MKTSSILLIIVAIMLAAAVLTTAFYLIFRQTDETDAYLEGGEKEFTQGAHVVNINTDVGTITVDDAVTSMKGVYEILAETAEYQIIHDEPTDSFQIVIYQKPFLQNKAKAERAFFELLDISEEEACRLDVVVTTPAFVDLDYSGQSFLLNYCQ